MGDDFLRLVSQANPASRQYQPANNGYPPTANNHYGQPSPQLDPFFDDDDDIPDSAFAGTYHSQPMRSQESGFPLTRAAAPPAGTGSSSTFQASNKGVPRGWDDDAFPPTSDDPFSGSASFKGVPNSMTQKSKQNRPPRKWRWPWQKEEVQEGERVVSLNDSASNVHFVSNFVSTSKYNLATFIPKFLLGMSRRSQFITPKSLYPSKPAGARKYIFLH